MNSIMTTHTRVGAKQSSRQNFCQAAHLRLAAWL